MRFVRDGRKVMVEGKYYGVTVTVTFTGDDGVVSRSTERRFGGYARKWRDALEEARKFAEHEEATVGMHVGGA